MTIRTIIAIAALAGLILFASASNSVLAADKIAVLVSAKDAPFEDTLKGFQGFLTRAAVDAEYDVHKLEGSSAKAGQAVQAVKKSGAKLILALGGVPFRMLTAMPPACAPRSA